MKIVITGSSGFLGSELKKQLTNAGHEVCLLLRSGHIPVNDNLTTYFIYDQLDSKKLINNLHSWKPDVFYHLSWEGVGSTDRNDPEKAVRNIELAKSSVDLAKSTGCTKWIGIGSQAEYGILNRVITETDICQPQTVYGKSKLIAGEETLNLCNKYNLSGVWARVFSIYGPGDHNNTLISYLLRAFSNKTKPELSSGLQQWDYLFIKDAGAALVSLAKEGVNGVFNIASGKTVVLRDVVELIRKKMNYNGDIEWGVIKDGDLKFLCGSINKIQKFTGWQGPIISLNDGIDILINPN